MKVNEVDVVLIPSLPELMALPAGGGDVPIYNGADNILYRIKAALLGGGSETAVKWNVSTTYAADVVVEFGLKLWLSLADGNTGNTPVVGSAWWVEVSKSTANGFGYWSAGVYTIDPSMVLRSGGLFYIDNQVVTFPFNSADFEAEYAQNKWVQVAGSGSGGGDSIYNGQFSFSCLDSFTIPYASAITLTSVIKSTSITDLRIGKNGATPATITFPYSIAANDLITFAATYDRESQAYFTLIGTKS